ncbi:MAG: branched chain amino acid: 2-keto-4-methylthiobutyrate aminotransferase [Ramlibacter sp.]|uniref:D-amino acid aminotransferase n=1 Tax=Ramlibacter sp. TaxID=1917967 RepID=UPI002615143A|nr:D-amino acid aminotransferase [Ramlibacter sp.]MDB5750502.1 branched chain amino acid: 2-keto-4-methylthiobutyrate aminotransferase [Ramlibacter sp.]
MTEPIPALPCWLNGELSNVREAKVSVLDRGFIFGDGVYEVVPAYAGRPFRFEEHMARLDRSLGELRIANPMDRAGWRAVVEQLISAYAQYAGKPPEETNQLVYLQVTRGVAMRDHVMPPDLQPTVFAMVNRLSIYSAEERARGVACVTADDFRWKKAHIKTTSLAAAVLARQMSADEDANETVMFRDGFMSEGAASNVWVVKDGVVLGPPRDNLVLEGIRYGLIEQLCQQAGIPFALRRVTRGEVLAADEIILSSATKEVLPCTRLDGRPVGNGMPGPIYDKLFQGYQQAKRRSS